MCIITALSDGNKLERVKDLQCNIEEIQNRNFECLVIEASACTHTGFTQFTNIKFVL